MTTSDQPPQSEQPQADHTLPKRPLANSGLATTELGFGGAPFGAVGGALSPSQANDIVALAWESGIRYFDTAPLYGHGLSEKRLGATLRTYDRDRFVLSTKVGRLLVPLSEGQRNTMMADDEPVSFVYDYSADAVKRSVDESLTRLGLDHIDVLLCHDIDTWTHGADQPEVYRQAIAGALPAMVELRRQGVVKAIGLGVNEWEVCRQVMDEVDLDCFLLAGRFTLLEQDALDDFLPACVARGASVIIGGPYNSGLLTGVERRFATYDYKPVDDERWERATRIGDICRSNGVDIRAAALQYPLRHPAIASVIPGVRSADEMRTNVELLATAVPDALWDDLAAAGLSQRLDG